MFKVLFLKLNICVFWEVGFTFVLLIAKKLKPVSDIRTFILDIEQNINCQKKDNLLLSGDGKSLATKDYDFITVYDSNIVIGIVMSFCNCHAEISHFLRTSCVVSRVILVRKFILLECYSDSRSI